MGEFKSASFVIIDDTGAEHKIAFDKFEGKTPDFRIKGNASLLLKRWGIMAQRIEMYLKGQAK